MIRLVDEIRGVSMRNKICVSLSIMFCLLLCGCAHEHEHVWTEADCILPKTCNVCKETEGVALGHDFKPATCTDAKICLRCKESRGEALGHTLVAANYQDKAYCSVCNTQLSEVLIPDFEEHSMQCNVELDTEYRYDSICSENEELVTVGSVVFTNYRVMESDATHEAREGYEWRCITVKFTFSDNNAINNGCKWRCADADYYDDSLHQESMYTISTIVDEMTKAFECNYHGTIFDCIRKRVVTKPGWVDTKYCVQYTYAYLVPIGYDGIVVIANNPAIDWPNEAHIYDISGEDTFMFRLK